MSDVENVEVVDAAQAEAEFNAGFASVRGEDPPAETEPEVVTVTTAEEAAPEPAAEPEAEDDPIIPGLGMQASHVKALLAKAADLDSREAKIYGKFGELQRTLNEVSGMRDDIKALKESGNRAGSLALSAQADKLLSRVKAEYPELGELLAQDLGELSAGSAPSVDVDGLVNERVSAVRDEIELIRIESKHPDWQAVSQSPEFKLWKSGLNADVQQRLDSSREAAFINQGLDAFKAWREKPKTPDKSSRLANAVTPTGIPASAVPGKTPEQEFAEGFNAVRQRRL